jgi:GrpB-like predicted nucleotidyltransferase (UPF0157 family)
MTDSVVVVAYDPEWPRRFEEERDVLAVAFAESDVTIEHIGSTAVPGLGAKPVIDIMVGVSTLTDAEGDFIAGILASAPGSDVERTAPPSHADHAGRVWAHPRTPTERSP